MYKFFIFVLLSAAVFSGFWRVSRESLLNPYSHGFYRYFAFVAVIGLIILNSQYWFLDPLSPFQKVSWTLLAFSILLAVSGFIMLKALGQPKNHNIDDTTTLVTRGIYLYIRHPLYGSLLLLAWGAYLKDTSFASTLLALAATTLLVTTARIEEIANYRKFGPAYAVYMEKTKMFIPFLF